MMAGVSVNKWAAGGSYGPVLSQTDLYLLNTELEINPILGGDPNHFHLVFNLVTGQTGGFNADDRDRDIPFTAKDEPAALPRVQQLYVISQSSPWCTTVRNEKGVTMADVCTAIWKDYTDNLVTDVEFATLPPRVQEQVKRAAVHNQAASANPSGWGHQFYTPAAPPSRYRRVDWLRERIYFDGLKANDHYAISRLGFKAPNILVMSLTG